MSDALLPETPLSAEQLHRALLNNWAFELKYKTICRTFCCPQILSNVSTVSAEQLHPVSCKNNCVQEIMTQCNVVHQFTIAHRKTATIANYNALYPSPADQLRCTDNQCFMMNYSTVECRLSNQLSLCCKPQLPLYMRWGGGSCVGEKGPQRIKEFKRNCPTCPNCPTLSKCRTQSELISSKTKGKKRIDYGRK